MIDPWENFRDPCYYDMWAVRRKDERGFNQAIHVHSKAEADFLVSELNTLDRFRRGLTTAVPDSEYTRLPGDYFTTSPNRRRWYRNKLIAVNGY